MLKHNATDAFLRRVTVLVKCEVRIRVQAEKINCTETQKGHANIGNISQQGLSGDADLYSIDCPIRGPWVSTRKQYSQRMIRNETVIDERRASAKIHVLFSDQVSICAPVSSVKSWNSTFTAKIREGNNSSI